MHGDSHQLYWPASNKGKAVILKIAGILAIILIVLLSFKKKKEIYTGEIRISRLINGIKTIQYTQVITLEKGKGFVSDHVGDYSMEIVPYPDFD